MNWQHSKKIQIKVLKEESAFVYFALEASEGFTAYSTLPHAGGDEYRYLELFVPPGMEAATEALLLEFESMIVART